jgi:hypothetical protein
MTYVSGNEKAVSLNVHRYNEGTTVVILLKHGATAVGRCRLNQVDP